MGTNFALKKIIGAGSPSNFFVLAKNGKCQFEEFETDTIKRGLKIQLDKIYVYIERYAAGQELPNNAIKELNRNGNDKIKDFEFRTDKLRVYFFRDDEGNIIVLGGINDKKQKDKNVLKLRQIKNEYILNKKTPK